MSERERPRFISNDQAVASILSDALECALQKVDPTIVDVRVSMTPYSAELLKEARVNVSYRDADSTHYETILVGTGVMDQYASYPKVADALDYVVDSVMWLKMKRDRDDRTRD